MQQGADDRARVDHGEPVLGATLARQVPGGTLGDGLGAHVGGQAVRVRVGPVLLRQRSLFGALREPDRGDGGGDDHPLHVVVERLAEHAQCALAGRHDQLVRVLRLVRREGGGHVQDVVAALDDVVPVLVAQQVGLMDGEVVAGIDLRGDRLVHLPLAGGVPDGRPDAVAAPHQLDDAPAAEIAGAAGDQNRLAVALRHRPSPSHRLPGRAHSLRSSAPAWRRAPGRHAAGAPGSRPRSSPARASRGGGTARRSRARRRGRCWR